VQRCDPFGEFSPIPLEPAKLPLLDARAAVGFLNQRTGGDLRLMNVEPDNPLVQRYQFHATSRRITLEVGRWRVPELNMPEGDKSPTAV